MPCVKGCPVRRDFVIVFEKDAMPQLKEISFISISPNPRSSDLMIEKLAFFMVKSYAEK